MTKVLYLHLCHMALVGNAIIEELFKFYHFGNKTTDVKFLLEQSHRKVHLHHIITRNNLEKDHVFATHKFQVLGRDIFSQQT